MKRVDVELGPPPGCVGIAVSTYNAAITEPLLAGAMSACESASIDTVVVLKVPGALELPLAAAALLEDGCEAVIAIGAVVAGETDHYEIVSAESARGLTEVALRTGRPVTNAVLAVREYRHAVDRSRPGPGNKGTEAAHAAIESARRLTAIRAER